MNGILVLFSEQIRMNLPPLQRILEESSCDWRSLPYQAVCLLRICGTRLLDFRMGRHLKSTGLGALRFGLRWAITLSWRSRLPPPAALAAEALPPLRVPPAPAPHRPRVTWWRFGASELTFQPVNLCPRSEKQVIAVSLSPTSRLTLVKERGQSFHTH